MHLIHDTVYLDTINRIVIRVDTVIRYNTDTLYRDPTHTDTIIITTTKTDTVILRSIDTIYLTKGQHDTITKNIYLSDTVNNYLSVTKYDNIIRIDSVISVDTVYGLYASKLSKAFNHIKINQYPDSVNGSYITHIYFGGTEYFMTPDHFVDVPWDLQTTLTVGIMYKYGDATTIALRDYFDPLVSYQYVLQTQGGIIGQRQDYLARFPYVNTNNLAVITLKDNLNGNGGLFGGDYPEQGDGLNMHSHYVKPIYKRIN